MEPLSTLSPTLALCILSPSCVIPDAATCPTMNGVLLPIPPLAFYSPNRTFDGRSLSTGSLYEALRIVRTGHFALQMT